MYTVKCCMLPPYNLPFLLHLRQDILYKQAGIDELVRAAAEGFHATVFACECVVRELQLCMHNYTHKHTYQCAYF